jgi:hypothetical protein
MHKINGRVSEYGFRSELGWFGFKIANGLG